MDQALIVQRPLLHDAVVAHPVAMVAGEDDDRVFRKAELRKRRQHAADTVVDQGDHAIGDGDDLFRFQIR